MSSLQSPESISNVFSVRIVSIDYYMAPPIPDFGICHSTFHGSDAKEAPVIRIYGSTLAGQKACLHVHRALPYLYVPCSEFPPQMPEKGDAYLHAVFLVVEKALSRKCSFGSKKQHVHGCSFVRAKRLYGYHSSEELFVKIYLYYPNDVARVAALLLGGAILDRTIQPYESHIPFLLQFLIDYNLYGMSHVHISRVKFRRPLPNDFIPRLNLYKKQDVQVEKSPRSVGFQADTCSEPNQCFRIWLSSTVPRDWTWPDGLDFKTTNLIQRQSICELEGDSCIHDIQNQISKNYTTLSQSRADMKMVQSLMPIWDEEYERTGILETVNLFKDGKPPSESILRNFLDGSGNEIVYSRFLTEVEVPFPPKVSTPDVERTPDLKSSTNMRSSVVHTNDTLNLTRESPFGKHDLRLPLQRERSFDNLLSTTKKALLADSTKIGGSMVTDIEGARLLNWLASSQAVDEINSDDELNREVILSPLFRTKAYEKVMEKAHLDYENASQRECQDIIDSIEETKNDSLEDGNDSFTDNEYVSLDSIIPQFDGSYDDQVENPMIKEYETNIKSESRIAIKQDVKKTLRKVGSRCKRNTFLWGSLPFSTKKELEGSETSSVKSMETSTDFNETRLDSEYSLSENEVDDNYAASKISRSLVTSALEVEKQLGSVSLRDMMRKKRSPHSEFAECKKHMCHPVLGSEINNSVMVVTMPSETSNVKSPSTIQHGNGSFSNISNVQKRQSSTAYVPMPCSNIHKNELLNESLGRNINLNVSHGKGKHIAAFSGLVEDTVNIQHSVTCSKELKGDFVQSSMEHAIWDPLRRESINCDFDIKKDIDYKLDRRVLCSSYQSNSSFKCSSLKGSNCIGNRSEGRIVDTEGVNDTDLVNQKVNAELLSDGLLTETDTREEKMKPSVDLLYTSQIDINSMKNQTEYFDMTFCRKPPTVEQVKNAEEILNLSPINVDIACDPKCALARRLFPNNERKDVHAVTSFFMRDNEDRGCLNKPEEAPYFHQEVRGGIPIHFQNDGSPLYLLTYALSPPSLDSVSQFVSKPTRDMSKIKLSSHSTNSHVPMTENLNQISCQYEDICNLKSVLNHSSDENSMIPIKKINTLEIDGIASKPDITPSEGLDPNNNWHDASQISGPDRKSKLTPLSQTGFRDPASMGGGQQLTLLSIEVQAESRGDLRPDPRLDAVNIVTIVIQEDNNFDTKVYVLLHYCGKEASWRNVGGISGCQFVIASNEKNMFQHLMKLISSTDPDILMGWETQGSSLGFLAERAAHIGLHFLKNISRTPVSNEVKVCGNANKEGIDCLVLEDPIAESSIYEDEWSRTHASGFHVGGRIVLNLWRLMRAEVKLNMYTIEAVAEEVLRLKIPYIPCSVLNHWFSGGCQRARFQCIEYIIEKAKLNLTIINQLDMINRTSELARVFGIDFFSVLSRGSQFRVESMLLRLAHTQNFLAISPGNQQVALQPAMECLPLVMEPVSGFYSDPVVVLDFQSLYPSMIIAYNLCFSTCLGKVLSKDNVLGVSSYSPDKQFLHNLGQQILLSPNEVMYVPKKVREGVLPRLLEEILSTRIMIKQKMKKLTPSKKVLQRIYNARQLALKLIANVTYGYTAAGFSGRMPCAELADSIVQCGRRTLETAIYYVNSHSRWKATVVYGDTDSMFVHLKGRNLEEAFKIGNEIASAITAINPNPVTLKFEKVYYPCFLLTKKRYVGYSYECPGQETPTFDAKGIETVRRDTCPVVAKILERSLRIFFEHQNIPDVKSYLQRQWMRILRGKCSLQDFIFAKEVRLGTYSANAYALPPAAIVATRRMRTDPRSEPLYGERVPYLVIHGEPGARLVDMVVDPLDVLDINSPYRLNDGYYINKQIIPALERIFGLLCVELKQWYSEIHRPVRAAFAKCYSYGSYSDSNKKLGSRKHSKRSRIDGYYFSKHCCLCGGLVESSAYVCGECSKNGAVVAATIIAKTCKLERDAQHLSAICRHCGGGDWMIESGVKCTSLACSVFYERRKVEKELKTLSSVATDAGLYPRCMVEWF